MQEVGDELGALLEIVYFSWKRGFGGGERGSTSRVLKKKRFTNSFSSRRLGDFALLKDTSRFCDGLDPVGSSGIDGE